MQKKIILNIILQALKPNRFFVMFNKLIKKFFDKTGNHSKLENLKWMNENCLDFEKIASNLDELLWLETKEVSKKIKERGNQILKKLECNLGGGGIYPFLYFIARYMNADCILETGVAAGFSSYAFLLAIQSNKKGRLYSSDFPYFRLENPEKYIGIVVEEHLKDYWELYIEGDKKNLKTILKRIKKIDIFHYDSDKSYLGRKDVMSMIESHLDENSIIIMDDIQDNSFFYDYIEKIENQSWCIFKFNGKYVGMVGNLIKKSN